MKKIKKLKVKRKAINDTERDLMVMGECINELIDNQNEIIERLGEKPEKRWKPKKGEGYWHIFSNGEIEEIGWWGDSVDELRYEFGDCFRTEKEAEEMSEKIKELLNK